MFMNQHSTRLAAVASRCTFIRLKSILLCVAFLVTSISVSIAAPTTATQATGTLSDILEQAAYQQDTANDPERAIKLYRQVIESEKATREMTAQAMYNTGLCYAKLKKSSEADQAFGAVVSQYKNVEPYYRFANAQLNPWYSPTLPRWQDGERLEYEMRSGNDDEVRNYYWTTTSKVNWNGRTAWKMLNRSLGNNGLSMVIADEKTLRPLQSRADNPNIGRATAAWTENSREIRRASQEQPTETRFEGAVYDGEQQFWMFRQIPMSVGTKIKSQLLGALVTDIVIPFEIEVMAEERIQVPAGQFDAYKLSANKGMTSIWIDKGPERYLLKTQSPTSSMQLKRISTVTPGAWRTVTSETSGFSISIPDEWFSVIRKGERKQAGTKTVGGGTESTLVTAPIENIHVVDDDTKLKAQIAIIDNQPLQGYDFDLSLAGRTTDWLQSAQKQLNGYTERQGARVDRSIAAVPALSTIVDYQDRKQDWVLYSTTVMRDTKFVFIGFFVTKAYFNEAKPTLDRILSTVKL